MDHGPRRGLILLIVLCIGGLLVTTSCFAAMISDATGAQPGGKMAAPSGGEDISDEAGALEEITSQIPANSSWKPGVTPLSNLTDEQKRRVNSLVKNPVNESVKQATPPITVPANLPESFDWRNNDGDWTTPIRDQGEECGSCWAHAAISVLESYQKIKNKDPSLPIGLSEQYLISCDVDDSGCDGGDFETAMPYLVDTPGPDGKVGAVLREEYPYSEKQGPCKDLTDLTRYRADKWAYVNATADQGAENALPRVDELKAAIYLKGPIAVGVEDDDAFDNYTGGIFSSDAVYEDTNHAVVLVGWGNEGGEEYFIGKNSVGTEWGEDGWFKIDVHSNRIGEGAVYLDTI